jgi:hypothetical protein
MDMYLYCIYIYTHIHKHCVITMCGVPTTAEHLLTPHKWDVQFVVLPQNRETNPATHLLLGEYLANLLYRCPALSLISAYSLLQ